MEAPDLYLEITYIFDDGSPNIRSIYRCTRIDQQADKDDAISDIFNALFDARERFDMSLPFISERSFPKRIMVNAFVERISGFERAEHVILVFVEANGFNIQPRR